MGQLGKYKELGGNRRVTELTDLYYGVDGGKDVDLSEVERMGEVHCSVEDACRILGIKVRRFKGDKLIWDAFMRGKSLGRYGLRQSQFELSKNNSSMAVFLGKNVLAQSEVPENSQLENSLERFYNVLKDSTEVSKIGIGGGEEIGSIDEDVKVIDEYNE